MKRRHWGLALISGTVLAFGGLSGCASFNQLSSEVTSFGEWPANRAPGTYAFERLPSQQAAADVQQVVEAAATQALEKAGFKPVAAGAEPDVLVQVAARVNRADNGPWNDPFHWRGSFGYWRGGPWRGPMWGASWRLEPPQYEREVALLLRDRASGKPLYETRARSDSLGGSAAAVLGPMYRAALMDFPAAGINPRQVTVTLTP